MRIRSYSATGKKARIEIIPMIDTMFFLLVFFMIATLSMTVMRGMPVNLPRASSGQGGIKDDLTISLSRDGAIFVDKQEVPRDGLNARIKKAHAENPELMVILNADEETSHGRVVEIIDEVKLAGVKRFAIATRKK